MNQKTWLYLLLSLSLILLGFLAFFVERQEIYVFWGGMAGLFAAYLGQMKLSQGQELSSSFFIWTGVFLRLLPLFALPLLSDDYFRFIWDGKLLTQGINPFLNTPRTYIEDPELAASLGLTQELFEGMNSPDFFTIYPPVLQGIFYLASSLFPNNIWGAVWVMKLFVFLGECGSLLLLGRLLQAWKLPTHWLGWYAWNPLVIVELTGNLHFEGLMIFFLLLMVWLLQTGKIWWSIIPFALAICCKLLPLMLSPLLIRRLGWGKSILYGIATAALTGLLFLTIFDQESFSHMLDSVDLYFANFEFNASLWYIIRENFGHLTKENLLEVVGRYLGIATVIGILLLSFLEKKPTIRNLPRSMMWVFGIYFLFASIVHPWYVCTGVALASLTGWRWMMVWTAVLPLTYFTYRELPYDENLWLVLVEYGVVVGYLILNF